MSTTIVNCRKRPLVDTQRTHELSAKSQCVRDAALGSFGLIPSSARRQPAKR